MQKKRLLVAIFAMALILVVAGCNLGGQLLTFSSVTPSVTTLTKNAGEQVEFSATTNKTATLTWTKSGGTLSATTGANVTWTAPNTAGSYTVSVSATDGITPISHIWTITVDAAATNQAPVITNATPATPLTVQVDTTQTFTVTATDADNDTLTYTWSSTIGDLDDTTGTSVTWIAPAAAGTGTVKVVVSDGTATAEKTWNITVTEDAITNHAPVITSTSPASQYYIQVNNTVQLSVIATDADDDTLSYSWTKTGGTLDANDLDTVTWTAPAAVGEYTITVAVSDGTTTTNHQWTMTVSIEPVETVVHVTENITTNTTWYTGHIYLIETNLCVDAILTIQPGVIVKFDAANGPHMSIEATGKVVANGTATDHIIFTASTDDLHGGDTNEDGNSEAVAGEWEGIAVWNTSGSSFVYCDFYYGGASDEATLDLTNSNTKVTDCTFAHNLGRNYGALKAWEATTPEIKRNTFYDNEKPLTINTTFSLDDSNIFHNADNTLTNLMNGIFISGFSAIEVPTITWSETEVPYVLTGNLSIASGSTLVLGNNVVIKLNEAADINCSGKINANATDYIIFTSFTDDTVSGDTNGDGSLSEPYAGEWGHIWLDTESGSIFNKCQFYYGGRNTSVIKLYDVRATITNNTFVNNKCEFNAALDASEATFDSIITGNIFYNNMRPLSINPNISLNNSNIFHNPANSNEINVFNGIDIPENSEITRSVNWSATEVPFVLTGGLTVTTNYSLELANNVVLKFGSNSGISIDGNLKANATDQIVFTSIHDDTYLGDTNGNGDQTSPAVRDWDGIYIQGSALLTKCKFFYGGSWSPTIRSYGKTQIDQCIFAHNNGDEDLGTLDLVATSTDSYVTNSIFFDNFRPLIVNAQISIDDSNIFHDPADPTVTNYHNGIFVAADDVNSHISWAETEVPFVLDWIFINENCSLTFGTNVVLKFLEAGNITYAGSMPNYSNTIFTSWKDDTFLGDTNHSDELPATGDWDGISDNYGDYALWPNIFFDSYAYPHNHPGN